MDTRGGMNPFGIRWAGGYSRTSFGRWAGHGRSKMREWRTHLGCQLTNHSICETQAEFLLHGLDAVQRPANKILTSRNGRNTCCCTISAHAAVSRMSHTARNPHLHHRPTHLQQASGPGETFSDVSGMTRVWHFSLLHEHTSPCVEGYFQPWNQVRTALIPMLVTRASIMIMRTCVAVSVSAVLRVRQPLLERVRFPSRFPFRLRLRRHVLQFERN